MDVYTQPLWEPGQYQYCHFTEQVLRHGKEEAKISATSKKYGLSDLPWRGCGRKGDPGLRGPSLFAQAQDFLQLPYPETAQKCHHVHLTRLPLNGSQ